MVTKHKESYHPEAERDEETMDKAIEETVKRHRSLYKKLAKM